MLAAALIVFRETLEAVMIIAIIAAATRGVAGRGRWMALGIGAGLTGAGLVALLAEAIAGAAEGAGQELLNAGILLAAVLMIGWHVVWMNKHGREMAAEMRAVGKEVAHGSRHMSILALVIGIAVMREGSEVVLMLQGLIVGSPAPGSMLLGSLFGLASGILIGGLMYAGFLTLPIGRVFTVTNALLVLIAGGMAARGFNFLAQAGWLPSLGDRIWNTSNIISDDGFVGQFLAAITGYIAEPSGLQLLAYGGTVTTILLLLAAQQKSRRTAMLAFAVGTTVALLMFAAPHAALAG